MHPQALAYCEDVRQMTGDIKAKGVDFGGFNINGTARDFWPHIEWTIIDPLIDSEHQYSIHNTTAIKADATTWEPDQPYDLALCTEVFEHTPEWTKIIATAHKALVVGGEFIITCASIGRAPHSIYGDGLPKANEWYRNIKPDELGDLLYLSGFLCQVTYNPITSDAYAYAIKL